MRNINHEQRQVGHIGHSCWDNIHEFFQAPELFSILEIKLDLEGQAVKVDQLVVGQFQIADEQDHVRPSSRCQIGSKQDNQVQGSWEILIEQLHLLGAGLKNTFNLGLLQIFNRYVAHIHLLAQSGHWVMLGE